MRTRMAVLEEEEIAIPIPIRIVFGAHRIEPQLVEVSEPQPRWDEPAFDEVLDARCSSL